MTGPACQACEVEACFVVQVWPLAVGSCREHVAELAEGLARVTLAFGPQVANVCELTGCDPPAHAAYFVSLGIVDDGGYIGRELGKSACADHVGQVAQALMLVLERTAAAPFN